MVVSTILGYFGSLVGSYFLKKKKTTIWLRVFSSSAYSSYKICIPNKKLRENDHKKKN